MVKKSLLIRLKKLFTRPVANQKGQSIVIITFAFLGLIAMLGLALDLGLVYIEQTRVKRAVDAAVLAGVVELPGEEQAYIRAMTYLDQNGYDLRDTAGSPRVNVYIRGCTHDGYLSNSNFDNYHENNTGGLTEWAPQWSTGAEPVGDTTNIPDSDKYYLYFPAGGARVAEPAAEFFIDTRTYQSRTSDGPPPVYDDGTAIPGGATNPNQCNEANDLLGTANKIRMQGIIPVDMNFMQFFGFGAVEVADEAIAQNVTNLDISVVFDMSGSMQFDTIGYGFYEPYGDGTTAWTGLTYAQTDHTYPQAQFVHPIPVKHLPTTDGSGNNYSVTYGFADSSPSLPSPANKRQPDNDGGLCWGRDSNSSQPLSKGGGSGTYWIVMEAELYTLNTSLLAGPFRQPGRGYWAVQHTDWRTVYRMRNNSGDPDSSFAVGANPILPTDGDYTGSWVSHHPYNSWTLPGIPFGYDYDLNNDVRTNPNDVPSLEYEFVTGTDWDTSQPDDTRIWLRGQRGGSFGDGNRYVYWAVYDAATYTGDPATSTPLGTNNIERIDETPGSRGANYGGADGSRWAWLEVTNGGTALNLINNHRYVLKIWAGGAGYDIDQIVVGNQDDTDFLNVSPLQATPGSAFGQACNRCNPIYGLQINSAAECAADNSSTFVGAPPPIDNGDPSQNRLYGGYQPIRDAKEAVKRFIGQLNPQFDQVGIVSYESSVPSAGRVELRCRRYLSAAQCFQGTSPISYTEVLETLEILPPYGSTNMAGGMLRGIEMLGISTTGGALDNSCSTSTAHCSRGGSARRVMIVMTDGVANVSPNSTCQVDNLWEPTSGSHSNEDHAKDCVMYYGQIAANNNVTIYTIGLGNGVDTNLMEALATLPGSDGEYFSAASSAQLDGIFETILKSVSVRLIQ